MRLVKGNRRVVIEDNGRKIAIDVADGLSADFINKIIILCRGYLLQYVYVELIFLQIYIYVIEHLQAWSKEEMERCVTSIEESSKSIRGTFS